MPDKYQIFVNLGIKLKKTDFKTFKDAFLFLSYLIFSDVVQKKYGIDPYDIARVKNEFWIFEGKRMIRFDEAIRMAEQMGIPNPFLVETEGGERLHIVVGGLAVQQTYPNFAEAFLNLCYNATKMNRTRRYENWIYVPAASVKYGPRKIFKGRVIYLDSAVKMAEELGIPSPFNPGKKKR